MPHGDLVLHPNCYVCNVRVPADGAAGARGVGPGGVGTAVPTCKYKGILAKPLFFPITRKNLRDISYPVL